MRKHPIKHKVHSYKKENNTHVDSYLRGNGFVPKLAKVSISSKPKITYDEMHQSQLIRMQKAKIKDATLVLVDMHDDMSDDRDPKSFKPYMFAATWEQDPDAAGSWVIPAIRRGLIKNIIFVVPDIKINLLHNKNELVMGSFKRSGNQEIGKISNASVLVTKLSDMPIIKDRNTVLSVDADFLGEAEEDWGNNGKWTSPITIAKTLKQKVPNPKIVSFFHSEDYLKFELENDAKQFFQELKINYGA